jgi:CheY-like chemotaxis protein
VVEDGTVYQDLIVAMLAQIGHHAELASNGEEALALIERHDAGAANYDLVLMDVHMPVMDGLTAARRIRDGRGRSSVLPIVALSARAMIHQVDECLAAVAAVEGGDDVVFRALVDLVGRQETEHLAIPANLVRGIPRHEDGVRNPLDPRRPPLDLPRNRPCRR